MLWLKSFRESGGKLVMDRMHGWVGRKDRRPIAAEAIVRRSDGTELKVKLTDCSDEGCRVECDDDVLRIGEWVQIAVSNAGEVRAQVRWALGSSAGVRFDHQDSEPQES